MAVTENSYTGNGSTTNYSFTFPYLKSTDVQVQVDATVTTAWQFANATTVQFNTAPSNGAKIKILRDTNVDSLAATFYAGSAIKSQDLNDNYTQNLYKTQEVGNRYFSNTGGTMTGDLTLGEDVTLTFEGATDNNFETKIQVADPTADRTITIPDITGTVVTTGDTNTVTGTMLAVGTINSGNIENGTIVDADINASADIAGTKLADDSVTLAKLGSGALPTDITIASANIVNGTIINEDIATGTLDGRYYTETELNAGQLDNRYFTETELLNGALDGRYFTETEAEAKYFNINTGETIKNGDTFPDNDTTIATTAAINDRIVDLVEEVGGFIPIANETSFPTSNPDVNAQHDQDANRMGGTIISVKTASTNLVPSGTTVTIANGRGTGLAVILTGVPSTIPSGFGFLVETTSTDHTYAFHRLTPKATEVTTVAGNTSNINTVATNISNVNSVGGNISNVNSVAGNATNINSAVSNASNINSAVSNASNITTVAGISGNVTTVAGISSDVTAVANDATDIGNVSGSIANVNTVAGISSNVTTVANNNSNVTAVAGNATNINAVAGNNSNITAVANNSSNINSAVSNASNINSAVSNATNINTVAGISGNVTTVAGNNSNVTTVAGSIANVNTTAGSIANVNTTAGSIANVNTTAGSIANVNTVATNITNVNNASTYLNNFLALYLGEAASAPSTDTFGNALTEGDFYFNTVNKQLQVFNGSVFTSIFAFAFDIEKAATAAFNALYTAAVGQNSINLGGLAITGAVFGDEKIATNRISLTKGSATYNLGGI